MLLHNRCYAWNPYFGNQKCWSVHLEGRGSEKVYCLYTHENADIFGWPLSKWYVFTMVIYVLQEISFVMSYSCVMSHNLHVTNKSNVLLLEVLLKPSDDVHTYQKHLRASSECLIISQLYRDVLYVKIWNKFDVDLCATFLTFENWSRSNCLVNMIIPQEMLVSVYNATWMFQISKPQTYSVLIFIPFFFLWCHPSHSRSNMYHYQYLVNFCTCTGCIVGDNQSWPIFVSWNVTTQCHK